MAFFLLEMFSIERKTYYSYTLKSPNMYIEKLMFRARMRMLVRADAPLGTVTKQTIKPCAPCVSVLP